VCVCGYSGQANGNGNLGHFWEMLDTVPQTRTRGPDLPSHIKTTQSMHDLFPTKTTQKVQFWVLETDGDPL